MKLTKKTLVNLGTLIKAMADIPRLFSVFCPVVYLQVPCLTFEVSLPGLQGSRTCVHDIPVTVTGQHSQLDLCVSKVLGRAVWKDYQEPAMPPFDVSICLPDVRKLKHLTERYKVSHVPLLPAPCPPAPYPLPPCRCWVRP